MPPPSCARALPPSLDMHAGGDHDGEEEELRAALEFNRRLKELAALQEAKPRPREVAPALPGRPGGAPKPASFTFKEDRLAEIGRGNLRLMKNLHAIHSGAGGPPGGIAAVVERKGPKMASAALNRKKQKSKIEMENDRMMRRLQAVKPTMPRKEFEKHADAQRGYGALRTSFTPLGIPSSSSSTPKPVPRPGGGSAASPMARVGASAIGGGMPTLPPLVG